VASRVRETRRTSPRRSCGSVASVAWRAGSRTVRAGKTRVGWLRGDREREREREKTRRTIKKQSTNPSSDKIGRRSGGPHSLHLIDAAEPRRDALREAHVAALVALAVDAFDEAYRRMADSTPLVTDCFKFRNLVTMFLFRFLSLFSIDGVANDDPIGNSARTAACFCSRSCSHRVCRAAVLECSRTSERTLSSGSCGRSKFAIFEINGASSHGLHRTTSTPFTNGWRGGTPKRGSHSDRRFVC
jgi:hypothetical protein